MNEEEQKEYVRYVKHKKHDYERIQGFLDAIVRNGLDLPKLKYVDYIRNIVNIMEEDDTQFVDTKKPKKKKVGKGFE